MIVADRAPSRADAVLTDDGVFARAHNPEVEIAVLAVCLDGRHRDSWSIVRDLTAGPAAFWNQNHRLIALLIDSLDASGKPVDAQSVAAAAMRTRYHVAIDALKELDGDKPVRLRSEADDDYENSVLAKLGGHNAIGDIAASYAQATALRSNAKILDDYHRQRRAIRVLMEQLRRARGADGSLRLGSVAEDTINGLSAIIGSGQAVASLGIGGEEAAAAHDHAAAAGDQITGSWGVKRLDDGCRIAAGRLIVLAARPGCGKTSMLLQIATATRAKLGTGRVALVSLEMLPIDLARILLGRELSIGRTAIERGWLSVEDRARLDAAVAGWRQNDIPIKGHGGRGTVAEIIAWIRTLHRRSGGALFLVGIDYLGLIKGTNPKDSTNDRIAEITRELKLLALELGICVALLCQMNRESTKEARKPRLSDLRDSGNIEQDADAVVFLHSDQIEAKPAVMLVNALVAKNRGGEEGSHGLEFLRAYGQGFREVGADPDKPKRFERMNAPPTDAEDVTNNPQQQEP